MKNLKTKKSGFTLIELIVVIIIIGVLAGIAVSKLGGSTDASKKAAGKSDINQIVSAINMYYADKGEYPDTVGDTDYRASESVTIDPTTTIGGQDYTIVATVELDSGTCDITYTDSDGKMTPCE